MNGIIDFHCHLDHQDFDADRHDIISVCEKAGYERLVVVADPFSEVSVETTLSLMDRHPIVYGMCAAHPHAACDYCSKVENRTERIVAHDKCIGLGEAGLDYHYNFSTPDVQRQVFARQIELAAEYSLPLIIHSRKAEKDVLVLLEQNGFTGSVIFHCYTGTMEDAQKILDRGAFLSFSGIITFPKAGELREVLAATPLDRLFIETDSPYLAPVPERGKRNSPLLLPHTLKKAAELKGMSEEGLIEQLRQNFISVLKKIS